MKTTETIKTIDFDRLVGLSASLYYNNQGDHIFQLGSVVFEVLEDPDDGYRSYMGVVRVIKQDANRNPGDYLGGIKIEKIDKNGLDGYELVDESNGHIWLSFGTDNNDDYYPCFYFNFYPYDFVGGIQSKIV